MSYLALKHLHVACVVLSGFGFALRAWWMLRASPLLKSRAARIGPHVVDTLLLASAMAMAWMSGQYPLAQPWLTAKLCGLLAYIGCGTMALKRGRTPQIRALFVLFALAAYAYIVSVAMTRSPLPYVR